MSVSKQVLICAVLPHPGTEARLPHDAGVAAVAGAAGLRLEHVVVVALKKGDESLR